MCVTINLLSNIDNIDTTNSEIMIRSIISHD
jgi:hypothetical protein